MKFGKSSNRRTQITSGMSNIGETIVERDGEDTVEVMEPCAVTAVRGCKSSQTPSQSGDRCTCMYGTHIPTCTQTYRPYMLSGEEQGTHTVAAPWSHSLGNHFYSRLLDSIVRCTVDSW